MRVYEDETTSWCLQYEGDAPDGGNFVMCPCGEVFNEKGKENCPACGGDLTFGIGDW